jgi:NADPH:quinone reductase-like Zn-dependent oxidoreductase
MTVPAHARDRPLPIRPSPAARWHPSPGLAPADVNGRTLVRVEAVAGPARTTHGVHTNQLVGVAARVSDSATSTAGSRVGPNLIGVVPLAALSALPGEVQLPSAQITPRPTAVSAASAAILASAVSAAWEAVFDRLRITSTSRGTLLVQGLRSRTLRVVTQMVRAVAPAVKVAVITREPHDSTRWPDGPSYILDQDRDLVSQVLEVAPRGARWILTSTFASQPMVYESMLHSLGRVALLEDDGLAGPRTLRRGGTRERSHDGRSAARRDGVPPAMLRQVSAIASAGWFEPVGTRSIVPLTMMTLIHAVGAAGRQQWRGDLIVTD